MKSASGNGSIVRKDRQYAIIGVVGHAIGVADCINDVAVFIIDDADYRILPVFSALSYWK